MMMTEDPLIHKYNVPGPRYTSYPSIPFWTKTPTPQQWLQSLNSAQSFQWGAGLYVHIPFCQSLCSYCGCHKKITRNPSVVQPYLEAILKEAKLYQSALPQLMFRELHLGGGTPTFLSPEQLEFLVKGLFLQNHFTGDYEASVEADPRVTSWEHLKILFSLGFRRLSLGVQDFDSKVQKAIRRVQSEEQVSELTQQARQIGFQSINYDLVYGLPFQTLESVTKTLEKVLRLRPDRIAFYSYAHVPWIKPAQRRFTEMDLPTGSQKHALYERGRQLFQSAQYREIGMDHFALETDSLWTAVQQGTLHRNFMGYLHRPVFPLLGLGVSSIGDAWSCFAQNEKDISLYEEKVNRGEFPLVKGHLLNIKDQNIRIHILNLMTRFETSWKEQDPNFDGSCVLQRLQPLEQDGLVELSSHSCRILEAGIPFMRNICMAFDDYLEQHQRTKDQFSQTI